MRLSCFPALLALFLIPCAQADERAELRELLDGFEAFRADFSQTVSRPDGTRAAASEGRIYLRRPDRFLMYTAAPDEQYLFTSGETVCFYDPFVNQLSIFDRSQLLTAPFLLLSSPDAALWERYRVEREGRAYTLYPSEPGSLKSLSLTFDGRDLSSLEILMGDGSLNVYRFSNAGRTVSDDDFAVAIPEDAGIDDERRQR